MRDIKTRASFRFDTCYQIILYKKVAKILYLLQTVRLWLLAAATESMLVTFFCNFMLDALFQLISNDANIGITGEDAETPLIMILYRIKSDLK